MKLQTNLLLIILIAFSVFFASNVFFENSSMSIDVRATSNGHIVSDFELTNIWDDEPFSLTSFTDVGTVVIIQFFATWCSYCHYQLDSLSEVHEWGDGKVAIITVSIDSNDGITNPDTGNSRLYDDAVAHNIDWYVALDTADLWTGKPNPTYFGELDSSRWGIPTALIISPTRELIWWQLGYSGSEYNTIVTEIEELWASDTSAPELSSIQIDPIEVNENTTSISVSLNATDIFGIESLVLQLCSSTACYQFVPMIQGIDGRWKATILDVSSVLSMELDELVLKVMARDRIGNEETYLIHTYFDLTSVATTGWNVGIMVLLIGISLISIFFIRKRKK
ncbi:MAG: TlpA family protein disulfide reductase [Candidatus Hermodarchaeota archaeon]